MVLIRQIYGYHRRQVKLTYEDFRRQTGIKSDETLTAALKAVESRGFFLRTGGQSKWTIADRCLHDEEAGNLKSEARVAANGSSREATSSNTSIIEESEFSNTSIIEESETTNSSIIEENGSTNTSIIEESGMTNSSIIEVLPLYKERSPSGKEREGERKDTSQPHPKVPIARSAAEMALAGHPATRTWLEAGMAWPGWYRLAIITQRLGEEPQIEPLKKARELWLMAGYRQGNAGGILDWYEALCRDGTWRPFGKRTGHSTRAPAGGKDPLNPTMAMLLRVKEERMHGR